MYIPKRTILNVATIFLMLTIGVSLFLLGVNYALAQTGENGPDDSSPGAQPAPETQPALEQAAGQTADLDPSDRALASGEVPDLLVIEAIPIQGRLTDAAGLPIHGVRTITMTLYDDVGTVICQDPDSVTAVNGLFSTYMDFCTPADIDGTQLYLGILVQGEASEMTPRQPIYITPYAYSLVNGANIGALKSSADTEVLGHPFTAVQPAGGNVAFQFFSNGFTVIDALSVGTHWAYFPIDLPVRQFGTQYKVKSLYFCYDLDNAVNYITEVDVRYVDTAGNNQDLIIDTTNRTSTAWQCWTVTDPTPALINGSLFVRFEMTFADTTNLIRIGTIKLVLTQN